MSQHADYAVVSQSHATNLVLYSSVSLRHVFCLLLADSSGGVGSTVCACTSAAAELPRQATAAKSHAVVLEAIFQLTDRKWLPTSTPWTSTGRPTCGSCRRVWPESSHIFAQDPLELLSDDTWEAKGQVAAVPVCRCSAQALCCEEITIVPALNTETDVDLISGPGKVALKLRLADCLACREAWSTACSHPAEGQLHTDEQGWMN